MGGHVQILQQRSFSYGKEETTREGRKQVGGRRGRCRWGPTYTGGSYCPDRRTRSIASLLDLFSLILALKLVCSPATHSSSEHFKRAHIQVSVGCECFCMDRCHSTAVECGGIMTSSSRHASPRRRKPIPHGSCDRSWQHYSHRS